MNKKISIITINYNNLEGLKRTMESVVNQTWQEFEYIVIDGGSTDGSAAYIESQSKKIDYWVSEPDSGIYNAMNKGIDKATGDYLLFLNSGDYLVGEDVFAQFVDFKPIEDIVYGNTLINNGKTQIIKKMPQKMTIGNALTNTINHQSIFFSKNLFIDGERYDCNYKIVADWVFTNNAIIKKNSSTRHIDLVIPNYEANGVSSDMQLRVNERKSYLESNFDADFLALLSDYNKLNAELLSLKNRFLIKFLLKIQEKYTKLKSKLKKK
jgi:glycosyltransferase involved in cell wall biosynthesis